MTDLATGWSQLPGAGSGLRPRRRAPLNDLVALVLVVAVVAPVPVAVVLADGGGGAATRALLVVLAGAMGAVVTARRSHERDAPLAALLVASAVVAGVWDPPAGAAAAVLGLVACWLVLDRRPFRAPGVSGELAPQVIGLVLLAAIVAGRNGGRWPVVVAAAVLALVAVAAWRPARARSVRRLVDQVASVVASLVVGLALAAVGLVLVCVPWLLQRLVQWDPLWVPHPARSRWVPRGVGRHDATRLWDPDPRLVRSTPGRRAHRVAVGALVAVSILVVVGLALGRTQAREERARYSSPALADSPWWPDMSDAIDVAYGRSPISSYVGVMMVDSRYPGFNVTDHRRRTWRPPADGCDVVRVWMFGGSTAFGLGQRDDHTIASALARRAWADGVALEVDNWGVPADTSWMETRRLELALAEGNEAPEVAVFYDGANDYRVQSLLNASGLGGQRIFANDLDSDVFPDIVTRNNRLVGLLEILRDGPTILPEERRDLTAEEIGTFAGRGYGVTHAASRRVTGAAGIEGVRFYQPARVTRSTALASERLIDGGNEAYQARIERAFRGELPRDVIDLSDAMDDTDAPVYYDELHTNELGARIVADAMWAELGGRVRDQGVTPCR